MSVKRERIDLLTNSDFVKLVKEEKIIYLEKIDTSGEINYKSMKIMELNNVYRQVIEKLYPDFKKMVFPRLREDRTSTNDAPANDKDDADTDIEKLVIDFLSKNYHVCDMGSANIYLTNVESKDPTDIVDQVYC